MGESSLLADDRTPSAAVGQHVASVPPGLVTAEAPTVATRRCVAYLRVSTAGQAMRDDTEEGYSLPAQRDGILQLCREQGLTLVDEYVDHDSASKNADDRPQFKAMLARIFEQADVEAVVVHRIDRFARDAAHHFAVRAALRKKNVRLISVREKIEDDAAGQFVEGIHALIAQYHSANLSVEVKKGLRKKTEMGGWTHRAPIGYVNRREFIEGRRVCTVELDPERAPLVRLAFELYVTGEYTLENLLIELTHRGLKSKGRRDYPPKPLTLHGIEWLLTNKFYVGVVEWNGVEYQGRHEPLVDQETFYRVQDVFAARAAKGTREMQHRHYLKGLLVCAVCGRRLSIQKSKGRYVYFYCLGQKDRRRPTGCREAYVPAERLEQQVEALYDRVQLRPEYADKLRAMLQAEIVQHQDHNSAQREFQSRRLAKLETQRRKLMDAYYAGAIDVAMLREEQERIGREIREVENLLRSADDTLAGWTEVIEEAMSFATNCGRAYRVAKEPVRKQFNAGVFHRLLVRDGRIAEVEYQEPFGLFFVMPEFEQPRVERETRLELATPTLAR